MLGLARLGESHELPSSKAIGRGPVGVERVGVERVGVLRLGVQRVGVLRLRSQSPERVSALGVRTEKVGARLKVRVALVELDKFGMLGRFGVCGKFGGMCGAGAALGVQSDAGQASGLGSANVP